EIVISEMEAGVGMGDPVQINLNGPEHEVLRELGDQVVAEIEGIEGVYNPESGSTLGVPQLQVEIDRDKAAYYGLSTDAIQSQIEMNFIGQPVTIYREEDREIDVSLMFPDEEHETNADLEDMNVQTTEGASIPLEEIADFVEEQGAVTLVRQNQESQMSVTSEISGRDLSSVVSDIEDHLDAMNMPEGYNFSIGGQAEDMQESFDDL